MICGWMKKETFILASTLITKAERAAGMRCAPQVFLNPNVEKMGKFCSELRWRHCP